MSNVKAKWRSLVGETLPIGYVLREVYNQNWMRIYSLPDGKRYADTLEENRELVTRSISLFQGMFTQNAASVILGFYEDSRENVAPWIEKLELEFFDKINVSEDEESIFLYLYAGSFQWEENLFSKMIQDVANELLRPLVFFSEPDKAIYCPYDGGIDIVLFNQEQLRSFKKKFKHWMSKRDDGL